MNIELKQGKFIIGDYSIVGNYDDGYTVYETAKGEDSDTLFSHLSFEKCIVWCMRDHNSLRSSTL